MFTNLGPSWWSFPHFSRIKLNLSLFVATLVQESMKPTFSPYIDGFVDCPQRPGNKNQFSLLPSFQNTTSTIILIKTHCYPAKNYIPDELSGFVENNLPQLPCSRTEFFPHTFSTSSPNKKSHEFSGSTKHLFTSSFFSSILWWLYGTTLSQWSC